MADFAMLGNLPREQHRNQLAVQTFKLRAGVGGRIDVDADPSAEARFGDLVPVLLLGSIDGVELCHYRLDRTRVARALRDMS